MKKLIHNLSHQKKKGKEGKESKESREDKEGKVRIISGQWRGRKLKVLNKPGLRPTPDRVRETLFNWLAMYLPGKRCLDLFAGSGALGIEAASRGVKQALLIEKEPEVMKVLKQQIVTFDANNLKVIQDDALHFLSLPPEVYDIVFLDPPYGYDLLPSCFTLLEQGGWLSPYALISIGIERCLGEPTLPASWEIIRHQTAGQVANFLAKRKS
ncbi:16S rRNA (guanine(966)-N(2))-methyltransferase RsmD [Candidatus Parabeggiatoa sp. HSG14]|uniref:16S rRNA (guanine(966)-N(2))-methyltransferase RsmD n=1 Tax=Candidatus Parabeggiatoa sp. HSG14 TaxID=3055593 RepID=UPI0025A8603E|nr:16S rRNA (guanine(966)-N(2))-methyltransferase RsmD [Thiotrichales bacterium HSG14]